MTLAGASAEDWGWALTSVTNGMLPSQLIKQQQNCMAKTHTCLAPSPGTIWPLHEGNLMGTFHPQHRVWGLSVFQPLQGFYGCCCSTQTRTIKSCGSGTVQGE